MKPIIQIGSKTVYAYGLINDIGGYICLAVLLLWSICRFKIDNGWLRFGYEKTAPLREKNKVLNILLGKWLFVLLETALLFGYYSLFFALGDSVPFLSDNRYFTNANYFIYLFFGPLLFYAVGIVSGNDMRKKSDQLVPLFALDLAIGKIACFFTGCCYGIRWSNGFFNYHTGYVEFPVQMLESFIAFLLCGFFFYRFYRKKKDGLGYPLFLLLYSTTRFFTEFLRDDFSASWLGLKPFQVLCLIGIVIGGVWLLLIRMLDKKGKRPFLNTDLAQIILKKISGSK